MSTLRQYATNPGLISEVHCYIQGCDENANGSDFPFGNCDIWETDGIPDTVEMDKI